MTSTSEPGHHEFPTAAGCEVVEEVCIRLPQDSGWDFPAEWIWAARLHPGAYALRNIPFYAFGLSCDDLVRVVDQAGVPLVTGIIERRGHSTYRVFSQAGLDTPDVQKTLRTLTELGCVLERENDNRVAVDIPPGVDFFKAYEALQQAENAEHFEFEQGYCGHQPGGPEQAVTKH